MSYLKHCKLFIGGPSGLSWLAWTLDVPVVMISGFSEPFTEFNDKIHIGAPKGKCSGCFNRTKLNLEWDCCPDKKNFECTKSITFSMVKNAIKHLV
jgi:autotransporter strand-loop-strand O-heptosyltransferase